MFDFISTSVPCETPYYIRANEEACQLRLVGASAAVMTEKELERAEWPAPFYIAIDHNSAAFPLEYTARLGALGVCHCNGCQEFTVFCNTMQTRGGGWGGGVLPAIPHWILTRKICFPCSVHSHPPGIHHTEVSNESTCLFKNSSIHAHQLADWLQDYFTIFPYSFKAIVPSTCKDII